MIWQELQQTFVITYLVAWLAAAEWIKPAGEMFGLAWSHDNVLGVGSFFTEEI